MPAVEFHVRDILEVAFQVRAFGHLGFTDWSASATCMCI